jgi:hypothetical protein
VILEAKKFSDFSNNPLIGSKTLMSSKTDIKGGPLVTKRMRVQQEPIINLLS